MMVAVAFWTVLVVGLFGIVRWGVRVLPRENMQILATMPRWRGQDGTWEGVNLTWYGVLQALAVVTSVGLSLVLGCAADVPVFYGVALTGLLLLCCMPAARLVARLVERKKGTFTVGGAVFVGVLLAPWLASLLDRFDGSRHGLVAISALAVCYPVGEGIGRLACISFGCCYGKRLDQCGARLQNLFVRIPPAIVVGPTRKAAYAGGCEGVPLLPVPALGAFILSGAGLLGIALFLAGYFRSAGMVALTIAFAWRFVSEFLRADYRGRSAISLYQWMALLSWAYGVAAFSLLPATRDFPFVARGLRALWTPMALSSLGALGVATFIYLGVSRVTGAKVTLRVHSEHKLEWNRSVDVDTPLAGEASCRSYVTAASEDSRYHASVTSIARHP
jgi:prolipoprotein diacylglyceryltransferase